MAKAFTGIDLEKEVDRVAVFLSGNADREPQYLFVVQGTFDNQVVEAPPHANPGQGGLGEDLQGDAVYRGPAWEPPPGEKTILFGKEELIHESIDRLKGKKVCAAGGSQKRSLERTPGDHFIWAAVRPRAILDSRELGDWRERTGPQRSLQKLECASLAFSPAGDGPLTNTLGYAPGRMRPNRFTTI